MTATLHVSQHITNAQARAGSRLYEWHKRGWNVADDMVGRSRAAGRYPFWNRSRQPAVVLFQDCDTIAADSRPVQHRRGSFVAAVSFSGVLVLAVRHGATLRRGTIHGLEHGC